jgi:hypothetical protein
VIDVSIYSRGRDDVVAKAQVTYAIPSSHAGDAS